MRVFEEKAKVMSKKPDRKLISLKLMVRFNAIHYDLDEHATLPKTLTLPAIQDKWWFFLQWSCVA